MHKSTTSASNTIAAATTMSSSSQLKSQLQTNDVYASLYNSPIFAPKQSVPVSLPVTLYGESTHADSSISASKSINNHFYQTRVVQDHQEMVNRHSLCLTQLREATEEADALRQENIHLRSINHELSKHLSLLIQASVQKQYGSSDQAPPFNFAEGFRGLSLAEKGASSSAWEDISDESPTSVMEGGRVEGVEVERFSLPKSISVRSNGYLKMAQTGTSQGGKIRASSRPRTASPVKVTQKVYVQGVKEEEKPLELEVYNQGMFKTELCNKWQETGSCPYGDHCQFAHGIEELRPVIRHPRYKTEVCRMVLAGVVCPYGHRCHFRHALTDQERLMGTLKPTCRTSTTPKLDR
ncbi:zinc finger CCCH domain-containing protein 15 isoform X1 [Cucumis sativus]|uniref:C3H1-type domain-containing protein n=1 Tax=Cucumis sativus TaxID=3659 RepID=A0A0A0KPN3_CUCSA|nr:zinc finger CCCH domain-containing protein 15 isoform X1 [Cucumis sativus]